MTMTYCRNCRQDVHITTTDCCDEPDHAVPEGLRGPPHAHPDEDDLEDLEK